VGGGGARVHREAVLKRGAAGVVVGPSRRADRLEYTDLIELNRFSPTGEERDKTGFGFSLSLKQEKDLLDQFKSGHPVRMRAKVEASLFDGTMPVLEAKISGKEFPDQEIIVMAHLDHYRPGANDNASGSAGMFEMARTILTLMKRGDIPPLRRTLRFLWVPELHGTIAYLSEHQNLGQRGIAGLNLDMIGENYALCRSGFNLTRAPYSVPGYINDALINLLPWLESTDMFSSTGSRLPFYYRIVPYSGGSDHIMFNDSAFAIPTPMLGHGDVFHHTNLDAPDKCDPTEMKRIICLALAASLYLSNAGEQDALNVAREVYSRACSRMTERSGESLRMIHQAAADPGQRDNLVEWYAHASRYPFVQAKIEKLNLRETAELCHSDETDRAIQELSKALDHQARIEYEKINYFYALSLHLYKIDEKKFRPGEYFKRSSIVIPEKLFKGPLSPRVTEERMSEEYKKWCGENPEKIGRRAGAKQYEIINLMNGNRSLLEIRDIISCEFGETGVEYVFRFAQELNRIGLVSFKIGKA
jgi:aminopeptidase YwaD